MVADPKIMTAVEQLGYRVTVGDVAAQAGLEVNLARRGLLSLASDVGGNLQVAESGEIAYLFPRNLRAVLRQKFLRLRLQELWQKVWRVLFYLIRISFGILLIASILLIFVAIAIILIAASSKGGDSRDNDRSDGPSFGLPNIWFFPDLSYFFYPDPYRAERRAQGRDSDDPGMNFLEGIFSFLFGDGNPNADLEERRWQQVATVILNHQGAVTAEQIAPFLDLPATLNIGSTDENYLLPALVRFDGRPEVSPSGDIIYHFPQLQATARDRKPRSVASFLQSTPWRFSRAKSWQIMLAIGLGCLNLVGALVLRSLLADGTAAIQLGGLVAFVQSGFWLLLSYGIGFLAIPLLRYYWILWRNQRLETENQRRQAWAKQLDQPDQQLQRKLGYAREFAAETYISDRDLAYTTEQDLLEQETTQRAKLDAEWQKRIENS
jgi:hypothetical protein